LKKLEKNWNRWKITKKLGRSYKVDGISTRHHEEAIQQEKMKFTRYYKLKFLEWDK